MTLHPSQPAPFHPSTRSPATLAAVALGGVLGTLARYALDRGLPTHSGHFPASTLIINLSGSLQVLDKWLHRRILHELAQLGLIPGVAQQVH